MALLPLTYFKGIIVKFQFVFNKKSEIAIVKRILTLLLFLLVGWMILLLNFLVDLYTFIVHLYQPKIGYRKERSKMQHISLETYKKLQTKFENN